MALLKKINQNADKIIMAIIMMAMSVLIFLQVISRYVFGNSFTWTEEMARYMFIWLIFLSIGVGFTEKKHISIDVVVDHCPVAVQKVIKQIVYLLVFGFSFLFVWEGYVLVLQMQTFGQISANMQIPMWWVYASLPMGFLLAIFRLIQASIRLWTHKEEA